MMNQASSSAALDPIALTRQLCEIESTTYHEGAVGDFLAGFLAGRGWQVEKTPVPQPPDGAAGPRWNVYAGPQAQKPDLVFSTHVDTVPPYIPFNEDAEFMYARGGVSDWTVVCVWRRTRLGGREGCESCAQGQPLLDQRRAHGQSPGAGVEGQDGALGLSRTRRERGAQTCAGDGEAAGAGIARH